MKKRIPKYTFRDFKSTIFCVNRMEKVGGHQKKGKRNQEKVKSKSENSFSLFFNQQ